MLLCILNQDARHRLLPWTIELWFHKSILDLLVVVILCWVYFALSLVNYGLGAWPVVACLVQQAWMQLSSHMLNRSKNCFCFIHLVKNSAFALRLGLLFFHVVIQKPSLSQRWPLNFILEHRQFFCIVHHGDFLFNAVSRWLTDWFCVRWTLLPQDMLCLEYAPLIRVSKVEVCFHYWTKRLSLFHLECLIEYLRFVLKLVHIGLY